MSGPVFVVDALGTPLMPLAQAHARKLLHAGRAQLRPHPTLTVIQLNRVVDQPALRPVLIGIALHSSTAELFVLVDAPRSARPLLYVVVDLTQYPSHRLVAHRRGRAGGEVRTRIRDIGVGLAAIWQFLPLSHVIIFSTSARHQIDLGDTRQLRRYLTSRNLHVVIARRDGPVPPAIPEAPYKTLIDFAARPTALAPTLIAQPVPAVYGAARLRQIQTLHHTGVVAPGIGVVGSPPLAGIYYEYPLDDAPLTLHIPIAASPDGVVWRRAIVDRSAAFQWFPLVTVALVQLSIVTAQPGIALSADDPDD